MSRRWLCLVALLAVSLAGCGGGGDAGSSTGGQSTGGQSTGGQSTTSTAARAPASTVTTRSAIEGVQTFEVVAGHAEGALTYPQTPPVGGLHNPVWQTCAFYDAPVPNEKAVHSLEHGAIWITYRADLAPADIQTIATLARSRNLILASRWDEGLPAPVVVTAWGRQLRLDSASDPRLAAFIRLYANQGPEINAPC